MNLFCTKMDIPGVTALTTHNMPTPRSNALHECSHAIHSQGCDMTQEVSCTSSSGSPTAVASARSHPTQPRQDAVTLCVRKVRPSSPPHHDDTTHHDTTESSATRQDETRRDATQHYDATPLVTTHHPITLQHYAPITDAGTSAMSCCQFVTRLTWTSSRHVICLNTLQGTSTLTQLHRRSVSIGKERGQSTTASA
uniref:Uncharacterized protein n=1 Tax=Echinococcus granulosus TaxID=6210 RepID=A0A068X2T5_ECHGR|nr:hypothetical protein EgrG_002060400 [Echinococcus granulosus]